MKPEEVFDFDAGEYARRVSQQETSHLRQQEIIKTRQRIKGWIAVSGGIITAAATGGAAIVSPIYAGRQADVATAKLKIIQDELARRAVQLHEPDDADYEAAMLTAVAGEVVGQGVDDSGLLDAVPSPTLGHVVADEAIEEVNDEAVSKVTDEQIEKTCSQLRLKKFQRLRCDACDRWFDSSFTEYFRLSSIVPVN